MASIVYNVTIKIEHTCKDEWLQWMISIHIPDVMATACFSSYQISRLIGHDDEDGVTYAIQYEAPNERLLHIYQEEHASKLQAEHQSKFRDRYVAFRSLLEVVQKG